MWSWFSVAAKASKGFNSENRLYQRAIWNKKMGNKNFGF